MSVLSLFENLTCQSQHDLTEPSSFVTIIGTWVVGCEFIC